MPLKLPKPKVVILAIPFLLVISLILYNLDNQNHPIENFFFGAKNRQTQTIKEDKFAPYFKNQTANLSGKWAIYVKNLKNGRTYTVSENQQFASASLYKLAVMYTAFDAIEKGNLQKESILSGQKSRLDAILEGKQNPSSPSPNQDPEIISFKTESALVAMITISENYSAILLAEKLGWANIDDFLEKEGISDIDLVSADFPHITAQAAAAILEKIYTRQAVSPAVSGEMLGLLLTQQVNDRIPKYLPDDVKVAHKTGELDNFRHDAAIIFGQKADYLFVFLTETQNPQETAEKIANLSSQFFEFLENHQIQ